MAAHESLLASYDGARVALEAVEQLIDDALRQAVEHERTRATLQYCTKRASQDILAMLDLYTLECDRGEQGILGPATTWLPDIEPEAVVTDAWSRAALPTRPAKLADADFPEAAASLAGGTGPTRVRRRTGQGQQLTRHISDKSSFVSDASQLGKLRDLDGIPGPVQPSRRNIAREESVDQWTRAAALRAKEAAVRARARIRAQPRAHALTDPPAARCVVLSRSAQAEAAEHERVLEIQTEVRGKEYFYDRSGKHVVVETVEADRMPAFRTSPAIGVTTSDKLQPVPPLGKRGGGSGASARTTPRANRPRPVAEGLSIVLGEVNAGEHYRPLESEQPALMGSLTLQGGVTLREGGGIRMQGRVYEPEHMSRTDFAHLGGRRIEADGAPGLPDSPGAGQLGVQRSPSQTSPSVPPPQSSSPKPVTPPSAHKGLGAAPLTAGNGAGNGGKLRVAQPPLMPRTGPLSILSPGHRTRMPRKRTAHANRPVVSMPRRPRRAPDLAAPPPADRGPASSCRLRLRS
jgi:hypothetical protein